MSGPEISMQGGSRDMFEYQTPVIDVQVGPVQDTWYTIFEEENCRLYHTCVSVLTANETLEVQATVDGELIAANGVACTANQENKVIRRTHSLADGTTIIPNNTGGADASAYWMEGRSVKLELRKTTALGAGTLRWNTVWGKLSSA